MKFKSFDIHRKKQWDLNNIKPLICIHKEYDSGSGSKRVLCIGFDKRKPVFVFANPFKHRY